MQFLGGSYKFFESVSVHGVLGYLRILHYVFIARLLLVCAEYSCQLVSLHMKLRLNPLVLANFSKTIEILCEKFVVSGGLKCLRGPLLLRKNRTSDFDGVAATFRRVASFDVQHFVNLKNTRLDCSLIRICVDLLAFFRLQLPLTGVFVRFSLLYRFLRSLMRRPDLWAIFYQRRLSRLCSV